LFLFQFLKYFPGEYGKLIGAVVLPGLLVGFMFLMPFVGRSRTGHRINIAFIALVMVGSGILTLLALDEDYYAARIDKKQIAEVEKAFAQIAIDLRKEGEGSPYHNKEQTEQLALYAGDDQERNDLLQKQLFRYQRYRTSENFIQAVHAAEIEAARVKELAVEWDPEAEAYLPSIPPTGALALLRADPKTQGPKLFGRYCASCHDYSGPDAEQTFASIHPLAPKTGEHLPNGAPNLYRFASREWVGGMLDPEEVAKVHLDRQTWTVTDAPYYGNTNIANEEGGMVEFVQSDLADLDEEGKAKLQSIVVALSADARLPYQAQVDHEAEGAGQIAAGRAAFSESFDSYACSDCHRWGTIEDADDAPDLTGYGSRAWTIKMIADPAHLYGEHNDRMPAFNPPDNPAAQQLSGKNIGLIVDWLRQDWPSASTPGSSGPSAAPGTH
jgi:mono/diheme cytochrome c family protein